MQILIKYGGHAMENAQNSMLFAQSLKKLHNEGNTLILTHGGGPHINALLTKLNIPSHFENGLRVTDKATMEVVEMVLRGSVNSSLVSLFKEAGFNAVGISGKDNASLRAKAVPELCLVGEVSSVDTRLIKTLLDADFLPIIAPIAYGEEGQSLNLNADTASGALAGALGVEAFVLMTDVSGVLDKEGNLLQNLCLADIERLKADATIVGGMIPKVDACIHALKSGAKTAYILDGRKPETIENLYNGKSSCTCIVL